jgi:hypothetical protein
LGTGTHTAGHLSAWGHHAHAAHLSASRAHATGHLTGTRTTHLPTSCAHATCHLTGTRTTHLSTSCAHATCHLTGTRTTHLSTSCAHATCHLTGTGATHLATLGTANTPRSTHLLDGLILGDFIHHQHLLLPTCRCS